MGIILTPRFGSACVGAPTFTAAPTLSDVIDTCAGGGGWQVSAAWTYTGAQTGFEFEIWSKYWIDPGAEPGSFSFNERVTPAAYTSGSSYEFDDDRFAGSSGDGPWTDANWKVEIRVVPEGSSDGAGPFCQISDPSTTLSRSHKVCV